MKNIFLIAITILFFFGCTRDVVIKKSDQNNKNEPIWVSNVQDFWEDAQNFYYKGVSETFSDVETAEKLSKANARIQLAEQIKNNIKTNFVYIITENGMENSPIVKDTFYSNVDGLILNDTSIVDSYNQRIIIKDGKKTNTNNRYFTLLKISKQSYNEIIKSIVKETKDAIHK